MPGYLLVLAGCLLVTLPLELAGARVYRRPGRLAAVLAPVVAVFLVWDQVGFRTGHWGFTGQDLLGWTLPGGLPVEEALFFLVVPICALLTWEGVAVVRTRVAQLQERVR